jgi:hypothetical protein
VSKELQLLFSASEYDVKSLLMGWSWLVPQSDTPLYISVFGDWVFGKPNGSLWVLSVLEGTYEQVANDSVEYNTLNKSSEWLDRIFIASWLPIAAENGLSPSKNECLGWKIHPLIGGKFKLENLQIFSMLVYQSLMGQLHRQLLQKEEQNKKPWYQFW